MKSSGEAKGFVFKAATLKKPDLKIGFSQNLRLPVPKGATPDQEARAVFNFFQTLLEINGLSLADRGSVYVLDLFSWRPLQYLGSGLGVAADLELVNDALFVTTTAWDVLALSNAFPGIAFAKH